MKSYTSVFLGALLLTSGLLDCSGNANSAGVSAFGVVPQEAYIVNGPGSSCTDYSTYKLAIASADAGGGTLPVLSQSVSAPQATFPAFQFQWSSSTEVLYVTDLHIHGTIPPNTTFDQDINSTELDLLMGVANGTFPIGTTTVVSNDTSTSSPRTAACTSTSTVCLAACGLAFSVSGVSSSTPSFVAMVQLTLTGYAINTSTQAQRPINAFATARVQWQAVPGASSSSSSSGG